ncbi:putative hexose transporter [Parachaetomium inaequale]|uniref:Hexose transporter n=1 Tax=Parachaetomium inaequale TaxID=2588326 RepID=A0AAN6PPX5_9PEZI|nr:putative hexose transporter [Parachaetomium inaequale]
MGLNETTSQDKARSDQVDWAEHADGAETTKEAALDAASRGQAITGYETLTLWETVKTFKVSSAVCFAAAFSAATDGYQIGMNSGIVANKGFIHQFATQTGSGGAGVLASPVLAGWGSIQSVGQIVGMISLSFVSSRFGRKVAMYTYWLILATSVIAESLARSWQVWLVAKLLAGIGVGCMQSTLPTYISEVAPVRIRGGLLMLYSLWWTVGTFFAYIAMQTMNKTHPTEYLTPIYTQWAQIGLMILIYVFLPESPAWGVARGDTARAKRELRKLNHGVEGYDVDHQLEVLVLAAERERAVATEQKREHWYAIFHGIDGLRTVIALWTNLAQQFIGLTLFSTFGTYFFQQAGLPDPFMIKCITSSINIATIIAVVMLADQLGRRWIACCATTLMWLSCIVIGILGVAKHTDGTNYVLVLFACFWNIGMTANGAAGWGFIGEISSQRLRPYTAGFGAACTCAAGVAMSQLTPYMVNQNQWNWGLKTGWFYAGVGLPFMLGMWLLIPETSRRSSAELDELFERKIKPWRFHKTETATQRLIKQSKAEKE